ncbi:MAG: copper homeostasis protein CutC [Saprospiraceae bacterium]
MVIKEACIETIEAAIAAQNNGAHQLEWCSNLSEDGLSPDEMLTKKLLSLIDIPVKVMIRCRGGHFIFTEEEMLEMEEQAKLFSSMKGVSGLVFGASNLDGQLDISMIQRIIDMSNGKPLTIHKVIDGCPNILQEVKKLNQLAGVGFILSSGGAGTAWEGRMKLLQMSQVFNGKIIAAGKIKHNNYETIHRFLSFEYYHGKQIVSLNMK